jgi:flagellar basal-body rod modification protein FlgD
MSITSTTNATSAATTSTAAASSGSTSSGSAIAQTGTAALAGLTGNFSDFLTMLMTQLQNQDPTSPLDSSQFTSELVQFSSVEQQINTNTNLTQLIQLTQASQIEQSSALLGKSATVTSPQMSLQNGAGSINFNTTTAEPLAIGVYNSAGVEIQAGTIDSQAGANTWQWNGSAASGVTQPDGAYTVTVNAIGASGAVSAVPFTVTGTVTSVQNVNGVVQLQMGGVTVPFSSVQTVGG